MSFIPLVNQPAEIIKAHILNPENTPLPEQYREMLNRAVSMCKLLDKHPVAKNAIKFHRTLYPDITAAAAYRDLQNWPGRCLTITRILTSISGSTGLSAILLPTSSGAGKQVCHLTEKSLPWNTPIFHAFLVNGRCTS